MSWLWENDIAIVLLIVALVLWKIADAIDGVRRAIDDVHDRLPRK
jgi:hypothetical protein